jgi:hypothetical protein
MRSFRTFVLWFLVFLISVGATYPVDATSLKQADPVKVHLINNTGEEIKIKITGPTRVTLNLDLGKNNANLLPGKYSYQFQACGRQYKGTFEVRKAGDSITLTTCRHENGRVNTDEWNQVIVHNKTKVPVSITFTGPKVYTVTAAPGNLKVKVEPGKYTYSYVACGAEHSGQFDSTGGIPAEGTNLGLSSRLGTTELTITKCRGDGGNTSAGDEKNGDQTEESRTIILVVANQTSSTLYVTLVGPRTYQFLVSQGVSKFKIEPGIYDFSVQSSACGNYWKETGRINLTHDKYWRWRCK